MNPPTVVLLSIPGLRLRDLGSMSRLLELSRKGIAVPLSPSFPAVSGPAQATMTTGVGPEKHGIIGDRFYSRERGRVEPWAESGEAIQAPQIGETLKQRDPSLTSASWFSLLGKGSPADYVCAMSRVDHADGSRSLRCDTKPAELSGALRESLGDFPLKSSEGGIGNIRSTAWIVDSFVQSAYVLKPRFSHVHLPHLDFAAQKSGPESPELLTALGELDMAIGALVDGFTAAGIKNTTWLVASEYCITPVSSAVSPNRLLREAGLLTPVMKEGREHLEPRETPAFAVADHQVAHVYVRDAGDVARVADVFRGKSAVSQVLVSGERSSVGLNHPRSGEVVLVAAPESSFNDDWWLEEALAPKFARIGDAGLIKGSHGALDSEASREGVLVSSSAADWFAGKDAGIGQVDVARLVLSLFGLR